MINLKEIESKTKTVEKVWGREIWLANTEKYCSKFLILNKQFRCSIHHHKIKTETFIILEGLVLMEYNKEIKIMKPGDKIYINIGDKHRFTGLQDSLIQEISTYHKDSDSYRDIESGKVPEEEFQNLLNKYL